MTTQSLGIEFIDRSLKTIALVLLILFPFGTYYLGFYSTLAAFSGGVWGMLNLIFISALVRCTIRPEGPDKKRAIAIGIFKFPVLYLSGFFLLKISLFNPLYLLLGFSSTFLVILLKATGCLLAGTADTSPQNNHETRAVK